MLSVLAWLVLSAVLAPQQEPARVSPGALPARVKFVEPLYPPDARRAWVQGTVVMDVVIDSNGTVTDVHVLRSIPLLDVAATDAVRQWEFEPAARRRSSIVATLPIQFQLPGGDEWLVYPDDTPQLRLEEYVLYIDRDRSRKYLGTIRNVSNSPLEGVTAIVSYLDDRKDSDSTTGRDDPPPGVRPPNKIAHKVPAYPEEAGRRHIEGQVFVGATINELGRLQDARVLRSIPLLDPAAIEAMRGWAYEPARREGVSVPAQVTSRLSFSQREVKVDEYITGELGRFVAAPIGRLEPEESREFSVLLPAPEGVDRTCIQLRFVSKGPEGMAELTTARQRKTVSQ